MVQEVPRALTSLKYFCEDAPEYYGLPSEHFSMKFPEKPSLRNKKKNWRN